MLVRHIQKSGGKIYGNKRFYGRRELRNVFLVAAENVMRLNGELRDRYDVLRAKGADHQDAKISLARQVASIALCLLKYNDKYNENYGEYLKERKNFSMSYLKKKSCQDTTTGDASLRSRLSLGNQVNGNYLS